MHFISLYNCVLKSNSSLLVSAITLNSTIEYKLKYKVNSIILSLKKHGYCGVKEKTRACESIKCTTAAFSHITIKPATLPSEFTARSFLKMHGIKRERAAVISIMTNQVC